MNIFLQIFLLVDVFLIGLFGATALRHYRAHTKQTKPEAEKPGPKPEDVHLSAAARQRLLEESQAKFEASIENSAHELQKDLIDTSAKINKTLEQLSTTIVGNELEHYRAELIKLRKQAEVDMDKIEGEIAIHQTELKNKLAKEIEAEKQVLIKQLDTKLADAVTAFLVETLQHNVDLGAQAAYLTSMLDEHKDELIKGVGGESKAA
jgi:hypothetical protein